MSDTTKNVFTAIGLLLGVYLVWHFFVAPLLPLIIVAGVVYGAYQIFGRKALAGGPTQPAVIRFE